MRMTLQNSAPSYALTILEQHLDTFGHVNNAAYLTIFEQARWELITQRGYGLEKIRETGLGPVILELTLRFKRELTLRQNVVIKTEVPSYEGKVGVMKQVIEDEKGQVCADLELKFGLFDTTARKLVKPTPDWLRAMGR